MGPDRKPLASTSAAELTGNTIPEPLESRKQKKLPSCDSCKLRRVLCLPQPVPLPCPRCVDKGIVCTTSPVVRKKPTGRTGKRIEEAKATFGTSDINSPAFAGPSNTPWIPQSVQGLLTASTTGSLTPGSAESRLGLAEMNGNLAAHLLDLYQHIPQSWLPLFPRGKLNAVFENVGRRLNALPPQTEVLAHTIMALTCRLSSNPAIVGPGTPAPAFETLTRQHSGKTGPLDLREFGQRRQAACETLRQQAVAMAWNRGTMVETSEESMAACHLLELLEGRRNPRAGQPYGAAFVNHLRTLLDMADDPNSPKLMNMALGWSALMMRESLYSLIAGRTSFFSAVDFSSLCGDTPPSIEQSLSQTVEDVDVRDAVTLFFRPMSPFCYHTARLARECSDNVTGTYARKKPLDEVFVARYLNQLDHLFALLKILEARIEFVLSPAATAAHSLPQPFEMERQYIMKSCVFTLQLAWSGLSLPLYADLTRRASDLRHGTSATIGERRRARERIEVLLKQVHAITLKGARMVATCVKNAPSLAFQVFLQGENLGAWSAVLREAKTAEQGGTGITHLEKMQDLQMILNGIKTMGWSWSDQEDVRLVGMLEASLAALELGQDLHAGQTSSTSIDEGSESTSPRGQQSDSTATPVPEGGAPSPIDFASFFTPQSPRPPPTQPPHVSHPSLDMLFGNLPVFEASTQMGGASGFEGLAQAALSGGLGSLEGMAAAMGMTPETMANLGAALGLGGLSSLAGFSGMPGPDGTIGAGLGQMGGGAGAVGGAVHGAADGVAGAGAGAGAFFGAAGLRMPAGMEYGGLSLDALGQLNGFGNGLGADEAGPGVADAEWGL